MPGGRNSSYPVRRWESLVRDPQFSDRLSGLPPQSCVLVSFSTIRTGPYDATRIVQAGVHPFVQVASFVAYRQARMESSVKLSERVGMGMYIPREPVTEEMRKDLIVGLYVSPLTPRYLKKLVIA